jgi:translation initiation factor eIF-2B subunit epsilon
MSKKEKPPKESTPTPQGTSGPGKQKQQQNKGNENQAKGGQKKQQPGKQQSNQKKGSSSQVNEEDVKRDQKLQAVILADSFSQSFRPITLDRPKVLLPVVNIPMLDYTIEFLAQNGVEEIIVYCVWYGNLIEDYIARSKWSSIVAIRCVCQPSCGSAGDALRELDSLNIVRSDPFILISGDVISNMNLKKAIDYHKLKRKQDPNNIMTCVLKKIQKFTPSKSLLDDLMIGLNPNSSQILFFEDSIAKNELNLSLEFLTNIGSSEILFHNDLLDCNIDICSQELLLQFSDNFDYQDIRQDFIRNEVSNFSLGKHLYAYILSNEYAARVKDPRTYHSISRDIVTRWVYPFVPEIQLMGSSSYYTQSKRYVYKSYGVKISRTAVIGEEVVLDKGTVVGNNSQITRTIVGKENKIGSDCRITNSHVWNNVVIEENVTIDSAIICDGVIIHKGAVIPRGCILSYDVEIGENVHLPEFSRITKVCELSFYCHSQNKLCS